MIGSTSVGATGLAMAGALAAVTVPQAVESSAPMSTEALGEMIEGRLRAEGPFFTPAERAVIERACGYAEGEWDGFQINISDDVLTCTNGRRADGPEVRAVLAAAEPRIEARVERVMASADVTEAIDRIAEAASAEALREVDLALVDLENLDIDVDVDPDIDVDVDEEADGDDD